MKSLEKQSDRISMTTFERSAYKMEFESREIFSFEITSNIKLLTFRDNIYLIVINVDYLMTENTQFFIYFFLS